MERKRETPSQAIKNHEGLIWAVADLLRGDYKPSEYGRVILPLVVLRRFDCVLAPTKAAVLAKAREVEGRFENVGPILTTVSGQGFYNTSPFDLPRLLDDPEHVADNLRTYVSGFSQAAAEVMEKFDLNTHIAKLDRAKLIYKVVARFAEVDLRPETVSNLEMGYLYEELVRKFSELSNETAGEHFTPREVIRLMVNLLFTEDADLLTKPGIVKTLYDPACGTGGMLSVAEDHLRAMNPNAQLEVFGQELNDETYAICRSDMMLKDQDATHIFSGNSLNSEDGLPNHRFDYMLANPPFGVEWKKVEEAVRGEADGKGFAGRFGAGLPRINDGSFLFLQHMISKMKPPSEGGSRLAIVFNGSPLFTGGAGSNESEIRRWIIESDWLEAIIALPDQLFYNTGISTYIWVVTNRKDEARRGKVQLIDGRELFVKMPKSLGEKRKEISAVQIDEITCIHGDFAEGERSKIFTNEAFGFLRITVERPLRLRWEVTEETIADVEAAKAVEKLDEAERGRLLEALRTRAGMIHPTERGMERELGGLPAMKAVLASLAVRDDGAPVLTDRKGNPLPDPTLRDGENVPLPLRRISYVPPLELTDRLASLDYRTAVDDYMTAEVLPWVEDAWVDYEKTRVGYEIPLTRYFYKYVPPRPLEEIDAELKELESEVQRLLAEVTS